MGAFPLRWPILLAEGGSLIANVPVSPAETFLQPRLDKQQPGLLLEAEPLSEVCETFLLDSALAVAIQLESVDQDAQRAVVRSGKADGLA
jgi:hypothetical protein